jgi:asparagine synthase (glutamine-hydrolysing)
MCGISGWLLNDSGRFTRRHLESLISVLNHRGPDDSGMYFDQECRVALAHNRLSILDLSSRGHQPMLNGQRGDVLNFNGEIYNFRTLRRQLEQRGYAFQSCSDTEVLLYSFAEWGIDCLDNIQGMYAFALWAKSSGVLHLVRDPLGIKPLYYWVLPHNAGLVFASEVKAFFELPGFSPSISRKSLRQFLEFGYTFDKDSTIFSHIRKLPPGHRLECSVGGAIKIFRHFYPEVNRCSEKSRNTLEAELYEVLDEVVQEQLVSDAPVGLLLSGGLDSSILTAVASKHAKIRTFSFGFEGSNIDERNKARQVSAFCGTEHEEFLISSDGIRENLVQTVGCMDDLFGDWGTLPTRLMYKNCRERDVKVVIVGEGADELFAGYWGRFRPSLEGGENWKIDWRLFRLYRVYIGRRYGRGFWEFRRKMRGYLRLTNGDLFNAIRLFESRDQLPNNYVMKVDKASMAESIEARVPFLDARVANLAYQIPRDYLITENGHVKSLLRSMALRYNLLPEEIAHQQKFGIAIPPGWLTQSSSFRDYASEVVLDRDGWIDELGFRDAMTKFFHEGAQGYRFPKALSIFRNLAWKLLLLNLWSRHYGLSPADT